MAAPWGGGRTAPWWGSPGPEGDKGEKEQLGTWGHSGAQEKDGWTGDSWKDRHRAEGRTRGPASPCPPAAGEGTQVGHPGGGPFPWRRRARTPRGPAPSCRHRPARPLPAAALGSPDPSRVHGASTGPPAEGGHNPQHRHLRHRGHPRCLVVRVCTSRNPRSHVKPHMGVRVPPCHPWLCRGDGFGDTAGDTAGSQVAHAGHRCAKSRQLPHAGFAWEGWPRGSGVTAAGDAGREGPPSPPSH